MNTLLYLSLGSYVSAILLPLLLTRLPRIARGSSAFLTALAALISLPPTLSVLLSGQSLEIIRDWGLPMGSFHLRMDPLSAWFNIPLILVTIMTSIYGYGYRKDIRRGIDTYGIFLALLSGGMMMVLLAWDGILFLMVWELMSFAAFFLVMTEHERADVRKAGWIYLAATHIGAAFLFAFFILWAADAGSFDFSNLAGIKTSLNALFILAVIGFGSKAGFFGLHVWLPEAHPAAPSPVSGLMSGIMIKMGIYGIFRFLFLAGQWEPWWGWLMLGIGVVSGVGGVLFAMVQHDIKRLLAYHSVENIGIICLGTGLGILGFQDGRTMAVWGFAGALFHVLNHAIFKTGLFMGAGAVVRKTNTRAMDKMGGLQTGMPVTALTFLIFSASIAGLPPLNGFAGELFLYLNSFQVLSSDVVSGGVPPAAALIVVTSLALIGGLALYCFVKVYGVVFLGEARSLPRGKTEHPGKLMQTAMILLAVICVGTGLGAYFPAREVLTVAAEIVPSGTSLTGISPSAASAILTPPDIFRILPISALGIVSLAAVCILLRKVLHARRKTTHGPLWACGYSSSSPRMQYTASSFVQPLASSFSSILGTEHHGGLPRTLFPEALSRDSHTPDPCMKRFYIPLFVFIDKTFQEVRRIQHGRISLYILYIFLALAGVLTGSFIW